MMTEFYVKIVVASIRKAYLRLSLDDQIDDFFALLHCYILEMFSVLELQERKLEKVAEQLLDEKVVSKKESDDNEAALLTCRREIYACFKLLGDLVNSGYAEQQIVLSILET